MNKLKKSILYTSSYFGFIGTMIFIEFLLHVNGESQFEVQFAYSNLFVLIIIIITYIICFFYNIKSYYDIYQEYAWNYPLEKRNKKEWNRFVNQRLQ